MNTRTWMLPSYLAMVAACGSNAASSLDASDVALVGGDGAAKDNTGDDAGAGVDSGIITYQDASLPDATVDAAKDNTGDDVGAGGDSGMIAYQDANLPDATVDASTEDAPRIDSSVVDAGECRADISELSTRGWIRPCSSLVDAGIPSPTCVGQTPGLYLYRATCDQRETWLWSYGGSHSQECFYDHGALVGARLQNDTPAFCGNASNVLLIGATEGCPATPATLVLNCNPFVDADWQPWAPDAL